MRRLVPFAALLLMAAGPAAAQTGREHFIQSDTAYDAVHAVQRDAFLVLRDSTSNIDAALARLMSGLGPSSSLIWMQTRIRAVAQACTRAEAPLAAARTVVAGGAWPRSSQQEARSKALKSMASFATDLTGCRTKWERLASDTNRVELRESAPYHVSQLQQQLDKFNRATIDYLRRIDITLPPSGAPKN
ncbi:MAG TPA: hypothetical protein PK948_02655 [Gemmatimonadales bacterium]|nr:hypothetical protein [Gemmatimonadales bacterium]